VSSQNPTPALGIGPALQVEVTAAVVLGVRLLALPGADLDRELRAAADRNPAFLARELPACVRCGRRLAAGRCPGCAGHAPFRPEPGDVPAVVSAWEQLRLDLLAALPTRLAGAAMTVLAALDERGLLRRQEVASLPVERLQAVLAALREVGPPGIGAATVEECLLLQLDAAPLAPADRALARLVLTEHAAELAEAGAAAVARAVGCPPARMAELLARLGRLLRPFPGLAAPSPAHQMPVPDDRPAQPPDLVFERHAGGVRAVVPERERWAVAVDPDYRQALAAARAGARPDDLAAVRAQLRDAATLVDQVHRRWALLTRLGALLADVHGSALLAGSTAFPPLTQATAAARLEVHASTVSRAVRHRTARLANGTTVPLRRLFGAHHDVRAAVAELLRRQPRPSDGAIAAALAERGYSIARRTVAKYRHELSR
jgi:RNA polymerase sigma-54 factor